MTAAVLGGLPARHDVPLAAHTTLRVGGPARDLVEVTSTHELVEVVRALDAAGEPVLVLGGGSNLLVGDAGFDGTVVLVATRGVTQDVAACSGAVVTVAAGEPWEPFVALTVERGWSGLEALSGIPGSVGASPIQNVGAYGAEVGQLVSTVRTLDRSTGAVRTLFAVECGFGYRTSVLKSHPGRYVVLDVTFQLRLGSLSAPVRYAELARVLGVEIGARVPAARGARGRAGAAALQGHGPRRGRPGHLERRFVLHQPAARRRGRRPPAGRGPAFPPAGRSGQDERGVADRARRVRPRLG